MNKAERDAARAIQSQVRAVKDMEHRLHTALHALDARDALLREALAFTISVEGCCRCAEKQGDLVQAKIRAILGEQP